MVVLYFDEDKSPWCASKIGKGRMFQGWPANSFAAEFSSFKQGIDDSESMRVTDKFRLRTTEHHLEKGYYVVHSNNTMMTKNLLPLATVPPEIIERVNANHMDILFVSWHEPFIFSDNLAANIKAWHELLCYTMNFLGITRQNSVKILTSVLDLQLPDDDQRCSLVKFDYFEFHYKNKLSNNNNNKLISATFTRPDRRLFLCLNKVPRSHRFHLWHALNRKRLLNHGHVSMWPDAGWEAVRDNDHGDSELQEYIRRLPDRSIKPWVLDHARAEDEYTFDSWLYQDTDISLISETCFYDDQLFITEKIYKAIANFHPFIIVGPTRSLEYLRSRGYRTFDTVWDESYDTVPNTPDKITAIVELLNSLNQIKMSDFERWKSMMLQCMEIAAYNERLFMSRNHEASLFEALTSRL
jgi:hypothetical protein